MYRIVFDTNKGRWVIQLQVFILFWADIKLEGSACSWEDYDAAAAYVVKVGLNKVYRDYRDSITHTISSGQIQRSY